MAAAMVIGANIGTTATVLLGAIGGSPPKKRVAGSHLIFNLVTGYHCLCRTADNGHVENIY